MSEIDPEAERINAAYKAGFSDAIAYQNAGRAAVQRHSCAWCGVTIVDDPFQHITACAKAPYRAQIEQLRFLLDDLLNVALPGEEPTTTLYRIRTLADECERWREKARKRVRKAMTPKTKAVKP